LLSSKRRLEENVATMADDPGADLDQPFGRADRRASIRRPDITSVRLKLL